MNLSLGRSRVSYKPFLIPAVAAREASETRQPVVEKSLLTHTVSQLAAVSINCFVDRAQKIVSFKMILC